MGHRVSGGWVGWSLFQALSGKTVKTLSESMGYTTAYEYLFVGYGLIAIVGVLIVLFVMGPLQKDEELHRYADTMEEKQ